MMPFQTADIFAQAKMNQLRVCMYLCVRLERKASPVMRKREKRLEMNEANLREYLNPVLNSQMERK